MNNGQLPQHYPSKLEALGRLVPYNYKAKETIEIIDLSYAANNIRVPIPPYNAQLHPNDFPEAGLVGVSLNYNNSAASYCVMCCDMVVFAFTALPTQFDVDLSGTNPATRYFIEHGFPGGLSTCVVAGAVTAVGRNFYCGFRPNMYGGQHFFVVPYGCGIDVLAPGQMNMHPGTYVLMKRIGGFTDFDQFSIKKWDRNQRLGRVTTGSNSVNASFACVWVEPYRYANLNPIVWSPTTNDKSVDNLFFSTHLPTLHPEFNNVGAFQFQGTRLDRPGASVQGTNPVTFL